MIKEVTENNYMEALLRAAILIGDLKRTVPVREITISGYLVKNHIRNLYPRCRIVIQPTLNPYSTESVSVDSQGERYLILFPMKELMSS